MSSVLNPCAKALEEELRQKVFIPFRESNGESYFERSGLGWHAEKSAEVLERFLSGKPHLTLGQMAGCLRNLGHSESGQGLNPFSGFMDTILVNPPDFFEVNRVPERLDEFVTRFRNPASHGEIVDGKTLKTALDFLFSAPDGLFKVLVRSLRS